MLLGTGLVLMLVPPILRDGVCGLTSCADQVPPIAVTRSSPDEIAIVVPEVAAPSVRSVELLQGGNRGTGSQEWLIARDGAGAPSTFVVGDRPEGFRTVVELSEPPVKDVWTAQVGFRCTTASLPFSPSTLAVGEVRSWDGVVDGRGFSQRDDVTERCATERGPTEVVLFLAGAAAAVAGSVLGIVVVLRRPVRFPEEPGDGPGPEVGGRGGGGADADEGADGDEGDEGTGADVS